MALYTTFYFFVEKYKFMSTFVLACFLYYYICRTVPHAPPLVEWWTVNPQVIGSTPIAGARKINYENL